MTSNFWDLPEEDDPQPWTLADIYNDLGTIYDVAEAMDIKPQRIQMWIKRKERLKPPEPVRVIGATRIYSIQEWKDWFHNWTKDRKPGTKWTDSAQNYTPPTHRRNVAYGNQGLSQVIRAAAADEPGTAD